jgi:hypothetical protein
MTSKTVIDYTAIANAAAEAENQQEMKEGGKGFERPVPAAGIAILRLQQYIEVGKQKSTNPKFKDQEEVMLRFELHTKAHRIEIDTEEGKKTIPSIIDIRLPKGGATSKYGRLFTALNYNGKYNHFAQMVGKGSWKAEVTHNIVGKGTPEEKVYANLDKNKAWTFSAPQIEDPIADTITQIPVPELDGEPKIFFWENKGITDEAYIALWDELFIEGEFEAKGDKPAKSKNFIQDKIRAGLTFKESRLANLLEQNPTGADIDSIVEEAEQAEETPKVSKEADEPAKEEAVQADTPVTEKVEVDPLLELL